jgi:heme exporter protein A
VVDARGIERTFGSTRVLRGVNLLLQRGETVALVGPNGAGKTTLLRILAGLARPTRGTVQVLGQAVAGGDAEARRPIGLLSHQSLLYEDLSVLENLVFAARMHGLDDPVVRARAAIADAGLEAKADELPRRLSRGMVQRAAIARALIHSPTLILLDEPFTGLDADAAARLRDLIAARIPQGAGVVVVTHQPSDVWPLATRLAVLVRGVWAFEARREGTPEQFAERYRQAVHG